MSGGGDHSGTIRLEKISSATIIMCQESFYEDKKLGYIKILKTFSEVIKVVIFSIVPYKLYFIRSH